MNAIKIGSLGAALCLVTLGQAQAANYCIALNNGFGHGGTTFISPNFSLPTNGTCKTWSGFTKTASTVIATSTGTGCRSTDGKVFTLSVLSTDPAWFGSAQTGSDHMRFCPAGNSGCPTGNGVSNGSFGSGSAKPVSCTTALLTLPAKHD